MTTVDEAREALRPTTTKGLGLLGALRKPRTMPDADVDWSAWIADIEAEARAESAETLRALPTLIESMDIDREMPGETLTARDRAVFARARRIAVARLRAALAATPAEDDWDPRKQDALG